METGSRRRAFPLFEKVLIMRHVPTTNTLVSTLKRTAKQRAKEQGITLAASLEQSAKAAGYDDYHHVTSCLAHSQRQALVPSSAPVSFEASREELILLSRIARRAEAEIFKNRPDMVQSIADTIMDLSACHAQGCALDFERLLMAPTFDFAHDVLGIRDHLNRETGQLEGLFYPRYSKQSAH
jgi:hypothetical protein